MDIDRNKIRYDELIRVFKDSPNLQATYIELARVYEELYEIIELLENKRVGFQQ